MKFAPGHVNATTATLTLPRTLGLWGLLPFVGLALTLAFSDGTVRHSILFALAAYGAVILSFLGGIHWGLVLQTAGEHKIGQIAYKRMLLAGVVPALVAWSGLLLWQRPGGLAILVVGFIAVLGLDYSAARANFVPDGYISLRIGLTCVVVLCLAAGYV